MSQWRFEPDAPKDEQGHAIIPPDQDAMSYVLTFGKHKGESFAELMRTEKGRSYLKWLAAQPCTDVEFAGSYQKRASRIAVCFRIYEDWLQSMKNQPTF